MNKQKWWSIKRRCRAWYYTKPWLETTLEFIIAIVLAISFFIIFCLHIG